MTKYRKRVLCALIAMGLNTSSCMTICDPGNRCDLRCPDAMTALCNSDELCQCTVLKSHSTEDDNENQRCAPAAGGEVRINEVLIAPGNEDAGEYIELVNTSSLSRSLRGMVLRSNRGGEMVDRIHFGAGCLPKMGVLTVYAEPLAGDPDLISMIRGGFGFPNNDDFRFELLSPIGAVVDSFSGQANQIIKGMSLNRSPDRIGDVIDLHSRQASGRRTSPGRCPNGGTYTLQCLDGHSSAVSCPAARRGDVRINEILIDGEPDETEEFVELVNLRSHPLDLSGALLLSNRGNGMSRRVLFDTVCMAPKSALAVYADISRWRWSRPPLGVFNARTLQFQFANRKDFSFRLETHDLRILDEAQGSSAILSPGISVNRSPDLASHTWVRHQEIADVLSSPSRCPNLALYEDDCVSRGQAAQPPPGLEELIFDPAWGVAGNEGR